MVKFINVPVPEHLVEDVFAFITSQRDSSSAETTTSGGRKRDDATSEPTKAPEWDEDKLRSLLEDSTDSTRAVFELLAERAGTPVATPDLWKAAGFSNGKAMGGMFSRVKSRCRTRWGLDLPLTSEWDEDIVHYRYRMDPDIAEIVLRVL